MSSYLVMHGARPIDRLSQVAGGNSRRDPLLAPGFLKGPAGPLSRAPRLGTRGGFFRRFLTGQKAAVCQQKMFSRSVAPQKSLGLPNKNLKSGDPKESDNPEGGLSPAPTQPPFQQGQKRNAQITPSAAECPPYPPHSVWDCPGRCTPAKWCVHPDRAWDCTRWNRSERHRLSGSEGPARNTG